MTAEPISEHPKHSEVWRHKDYPEPSFETNPFVAQIDSLAAKVALLEQTQSGSAATDAKFAQWAEVFAKDLTANRDLIINLDKRLRTLSGTVSDCLSEQARLRQRVSDLFDKHSTI